MAFEGKVCIVTGGCSGIGKSIATKFLNEGASVVIADKTASKTPESDLRKNSLLFLIEADVTLDSVPQRIVDDTIKKFGRIDILINNAGMGNNPNIRDPEEIENFDFIFNASYTPYYSMSKAALHMYTKSLASRLTCDGIRVNELNPGFIKTAFYSNFFSTKDKPISHDEGLDIVKNSIEPRIPIQRLAEPDEVANVALFLAGSGASYISGASIVVDGGVLAIDMWGDTFKK
uniref:SDR family oxidoreductase n=1 Tax=Rhabditophanes sp. KR3021 TaxID=114890 RepID=A0AC35TWL4_9BILA